MGFRLSANVVTLVLSLTNLSYGAPTAQDSCSALVKYADQNADKVPAKDAYACLLSPPFNQTRSGYIHEQIWRMANILSSQAFFNHPKDLPLIVDRVDLNGTFNAIKKKIDTKTYQSDYQFHRDLTELFGGYHDGHTKYYTLCMLGFGAFKHDYPLVSIVPAGEDTPRIYLADPSTGEVGEEIVEITGEPALDHLLKLVKVMKGPTDAAWIDADTRWNGLFVGRYAQGIQAGNFAERDLYPGADFKMKTKTGKIIDVAWYVNGPGASNNKWKQVFKSTDSFIAACIPPKTTENQLPEPTGDPRDDPTTTDGTADGTVEGTEDTDEGSYDETADFPEPEGTSIAGTSTVPTKHHGSGRPTHPDLKFLDFIAKRVKRSTQSVRQDFGVDWRKVLSARGDGSTVKDYSALHFPDKPPIAYPEVITRLNGTEQTLHLLKAYPDVAVWGFHAFMPLESSIGSASVDETQLFFYYWRDYMIKNLQLLREKGVNRLILDMSKNGGGLVVLGMETVRRFFPEAEPFYGVDYRRSPLVDLLLEALNVTGGLNQINGKPFASTDDFMNPPVAKRGDYFTQIGRFNQLGATRPFLPGVDFTFKGEPPFSTQNVVILTDGQCGSTCAITVEALAGIGVATVVTGGQPCAYGNKTMQYIGGIKGYEVLNGKDLALSPDDPFNENITPDLERYIPRPLDINYDASFNYRNSYTPDDHIIPQEFIFQPADAHLWYTKQMISDRTILWNDVVKLTWDDKGVNKLLKARTGSDKPQSKGGVVHTVGSSQHLKQPQAGYKGQRTREILRLGVLADFKYLASGWLNAWGGKG